MAYVNSLPIDKVVNQSIGLAFIVYPKAISTLPYFKHLFGIIFFGILVIAGLSSAISILEAFTSAVVDKFHYPRKVVVSVLSVLGFLGGIIFTTQAGLYLLDIVDHFLTNYGLVIGGIFECFILGWIYKAKRLREHISHTSQIRLSKLWDFSIKVISPLVLIVLLTSSLKQEFSSAYGGYSPLALILVGMNWLIYTLFFAFIVAAYGWRKELKENVHHQ